MPVMFHEHAGDPTTWTTATPCNGGGPTERPPDPDPPSDDWMEYLVTNTKTYEGREGGWYCTTTEDGPIDLRVICEGWVILVVDA